MTVNPDWDALSEWERDILRELDWEVNSSEHAFQLFVGAFLTAVGAVLALVAFTFSLVVALVGIVTMGLGIGLGVVPGLRARKGMDTRRNRRGVL
jgi:energy-converting hydrogenase Eha subunit H